MFSIGQKIINETVYILFFCTNLRNLVGVLYLQHIPVWTSHISTAQWQQEVHGPKLDNPGLGMHAQVIKL